MGDVDPYPALWDRSNPYERDGLSREVHALLTYLSRASVATGVPARVTSTTDHPPGTTYHRRAGTDGLGLALDCRGAESGDDIHRAVFDLWKPVENQLAELIYADPPSALRVDGVVGAYNIKNGRRVPPYATAGHHNHVHVAVPRGTFVLWPGPTLEDDMLRPDEAADLKALKNHTAEVDRKLGEVLGKLDRLVAALEAKG